MSAALTAMLEDVCRNAAISLKDLRRGWGSAYEITERLSVWRAMRRDSQVTLIANNPERLRDLIAANYNANPVPRSSPVAQPAPVAVPALHPLMSPGEVADVFGVDPKTVARWQDVGDLDSVRLPSGIRRYFRAQVEALLRDQPLTPEQVRALREELANLAQGREQVTPARPKGGGQVAYAAPRELRARSGGLLQAESPRTPQRHRKTGRRTRGYGQAYFAWSLWPLSLAGRPAPWLVACCCGPGWPVCVLRISSS